MRVVTTKRALLLPAEALLVNEQLGGWGGDSGGATVGCVAESHQVTDGVLCHEQSSSMLEPEALVLDFCQEHVFVPHLLVNGSHLGCALGECR
jgi:hypothetical protein